MAVHYDTDGAVAIVTLDRPDVANAIDRPTADELVATPCAGSKRTTRCRSPCSPERAASSAPAPTSRRCASRARRGPAASSPTATARSGPRGCCSTKPVIAAVEGHAVAGGLELAAWCDLRVAAEDAVFGVYCRRWGIPLMDGGTIRLARLIGHSHALDLILTGRGVSGEEALRMGLANRARPARRGALRRDSNSPRTSRRVPRQRCAATACRPTSSGRCRSTTRSCSEYEHGMATLQTGELFGGLEDYASGGWRDSAA